MKLGAFKKPAALAGGDCIGLVATGSALSRERLELGVSALEKLGFRTRLPFDPSVYYGKSDFGFAAESARVRAKGLTALMADPEVRAVLAVRGAYGSLDVLPLIDFENMAAQPKLIIGSSDITALLIPWVEKSGVHSIHGPTLGSSFADYSTDAGARASVDALLLTLTDPSYRFSAPVQPLREGRSSGRMLVGNVTMLLALMGTPWEPDYSDAILVVEDVGEAPYRMHRAFTQLKLAGRLDRLRGLAFGRFAKCESKNGPTIEDVFSLIATEILAGTNWPIVKGLEVGHWGKNMPLALGCAAEIDGGMFRVMESPVESR